MSKSTVRAVRVFKTLLLMVASVTLILIVITNTRKIVEEYMKEYKGTESYEGTDVEVVLPEKPSAKVVAGILKDAGLIKYENAFVGRAGKEYKGRFKEGTYTLNTGMNTFEMMEALGYYPENMEPIGTLLVPEGFSIEMIAARCEEQGICTAEEFIIAVNSVTEEDFEYLKDVPAGAKVNYRLQGYLFPATYQIYESTTAKSLVNDMLAAFCNYYDDNIKARAQVLGYSTFDVLTLASMIEREAAVDSERVIISGVFQNRLKADMPLQVDPTVLYPLTGGMFNRSQVLYEDLELDSAYNTYRYTGLPAGPICNPGLDCINAAIYPQEHKYLYYHVDDANTGTHIFTETYDEHISTQ